MRQADPHSHGSRRLRRESLWLNCGYDKLRRNEPNSSQAAGGAIGRRAARPQPNRPRRRPRPRSRFTPFDCEDEEENEDEKFRRHATILADTDVEGCPENDFSLTHRKNPISFAKSVSSARFTALFPKLRW